jgi:hypothetical protein
VESIIFLLLYNNPLSREFLYLSYNKSRFLARQPQQLLVLVLPSLLNGLQKITALLINLTLSLSGERRLPMFTQ